MPAKGNTTEHILEYTADSGSSRLVLNTNTVITSQPLEETTEVEEATADKQEINDNTDASQHFEQQRIYACHIEREEQEQEEQIPEVPPEELQDYSFLDQFTYDQHCHPRKDDVIHYFDLDIQDWSRVK